MDITPFRVVVWFIRLLLVLLLLGVAGGVVWILMKIL